jgi:hypothetical protein
MARLVWTLPDGESTARWAVDDGGGSQQPVPSGGYQCPVAGDGQISVAPNTDTVFPWEFFSGYVEPEAEEDVLDTTDPEAPTIIEAGFYIASFYAICFDGPQSGKFMSIAVGLDWDGYSNLAETVIPMTIGTPYGVVNPTASVMLMGNCPSGSVVKAFVRHNGAGSLNIGFTSILSRVRDLA